MTKIIVEQLRQTPVAERRVEIVERKGTGHPDTICDAIMEEVSIALCREYFRVFGRILHHNADKALLVAGRTAPRLGGGAVLEPMRLIFADRATSEYGGKRIDVEGIAVDAASKWIRKHLRYVDPQKHIIFQNEFKAGSPELTSIFDRTAICANDTSAAVGYAPYTSTEWLVILTEKYINSEEFKTRFPMCGEDVKVMGYRCDRHVTITVAAAFVDRHISDAGSYFAIKEEMRKDITTYLASLKISMDTLTVHINTLDDPRMGDQGMYLTVLGSSAEGGDCGQVGRGNRVNGVISLNRPMNTEAAAGKNPLSHVGKIYSLLAHRIADNVYTKVPGLAEVYIRLGSQIGSPIHKPAIISAELISLEDASIKKRNTLVAEIIERELAEITTFSEQLAGGALPVY